MMHRWQRCPFCCRKGASGDHRENGKGKSTLLKTLIGELPALGGSFKFGQNVEWGYFDQQKAVMEQAPTQQTVL